VAALPEVRVELRRDGPIVVTGPVTVQDADGDVVEHRVFLCRCGASAAKPRCDGTHKRIGFRAPGVAPPDR
jgi:CDGSH-type Zn-finger protein